MNEDAPRRSPVRAIFGACGMALAGFAFQAWLAMSSAGFRGYGGAWAAMLTGGAAVLVFAFAVVVSFIAEWLHRRGRWPKWLGRRAILIAGVALLGLGIGSGVYESIPRVRLVNRVPAAKGLVSEVQVAGFNSFLAGRWLYSFRVTPADAERIAASLELQEDPKVDLRSSLGRDAVLSENPLPGDMVVPEGTRGYRRYAEDGQRADWVTMAVSEEHQRAWLYMGFQN